MNRPDWISISCAKFLGEGYLAGDSFGTCFARCSSAQSIDRSIRNCIQIIINISKIIPIFPIFSNHPIIHSGTYEQGKLSWETLTSGTYYKFYTEIKRGAGFLYYLVILIAVKTYVLMMNKKIKKNKFQSFQFWWTISLKELPN